MSSSEECEICSQVRPLSKHLYELGQFCFYLDNTSRRSSDEKDSDEEIEYAKTTVISDWLILASRVERVDVDTWKHAPSSDVYCEPLIEMHHSDSQSFSNYATALTKFLFISNSLEEAYRFASHKYDEYAKLTNLQKKLRTPSMQMCALIDLMSTSELPMHFQHLANNFTAMYNQYVRLHSPPKLSGMNSVDGKNISYCLHLIRNLRNQVAHGDFPLNKYIDPLDNEDGLELLRYLLAHASRISALYIQMLLKKYNEGFLSYEYKMTEGARDNCESFEYFIENCNLNYITNLHISGEFSLAAPYGKIIRRE